MACMNASVSFINKGEMIADNQSRGRVYIAYSKDYA